MIYAAITYFLFIYCGLFLFLGKDKSGIIHQKTSLFNHILYSKLFSMPYQDEIDHLDAKAL
jgi:hypothetical protein